MLTYRDQILLRVRRSLLGLPSDGAVLLPGVAICAMIAMAATFVTEHHGGPTLLYALLFGMVLHFLVLDAKIAPGVRFASTTLLRTGVALLGVRIGADQIALLGFGPMVTVVFGVAFTMAAASVLAPLLGLSRTLGVLSGGAVAICGASAALAIAAVLPRHSESERETLFTVIAVTALSTIAMIVYPVIARAIGFHDFEAGFLLGGTIHDVAQVVGAGHLISPQAESIATYVKLLRVAMLMPMVLIVAWAFRRQPVGEGSSKRPPVLPFFLVAFAGFVALNSFQALPLRVIEGLSGASRWMLVTAIAGLGMKSSLQDISKVGLRPLLLVAGETVFLLGFVVIAILWQR